MKKFLIFLVATITAVCIGVTFYQFAKNDEIIRVKAQTVYINYGDTLSLDDLGFSRTEPSKETKIDFNAGGDDVTSIIKYDSLSKCYIPTSKGGATTIKISTTNKKYKMFTINVVVGVGSEEFPYFIGDEQELFDMCNQYIDSNSNFKLINNIEITKSHDPIGLIDGEYKEFTGIFDGNYHTISNLQINPCEYGGLFAIMGANSQVNNLNIDKANISGEFGNIGTVAGKCYGKINKVVVSNASINNTKSSGQTGAVVGHLDSDSTSYSNGQILRTSAYTDENKLIMGNGVVGGIAATASSSSIHACYTNLKLKSTTNSCIGGLVGLFMADSNSYIRESYSISKIESTSSTYIGNIAGKTALVSGATISDSAKKLVLVGLYYNNSLNTFKGVGSDSAKLSDVTTFAVSGKSTAQMKTKSTYIYYIDSASKVTYWDKVWYLVDGSYPSLTFVNQFEDVTLEGETQTPTTPDDGTPDINNPDDTTSDEVVQIASKEDLKNSLQKVGSISGTYILTADIDMSGETWCPTNFSGTFTSASIPDNPYRHYTISNLTIVGNDLQHIGLFSFVSNAKISNITFSNVSVTSEKEISSAGVICGYMGGNVTISNLTIDNATISAKSIYAGGIAGYSNNINRIEKTNILNLTVGENTFTKTPSNSGGIIGYSSSDTYIISNKVENSNNNIYGLERIGGIASVNHGTISDCSVEGNIKPYSNSTVGYFGGLCGINYSKILSSSSFAEISVQNNSADTFYYVAGLSGYNKGIINNSSAYANEYKVDDSTNNIFISGLVACNEGQISLSVAEVEQIGSVKNNVYVAGLVVYNNGGTISGCFAFGNLSGYQVAGIVHTSTNKGTIDSCMSALNDSTRATYSGSMVTSLAYEITNGSMSNCLVMAELHCTNKDGWVAGFAGFMPYSKDNYATISYCIADVSFSGVGDKYLDIAQDGLFKSTQTTGKITNCIINADAKNEKAIVSEYTKTLTGKLKEAGSGSNYTVKTTDELKNIETYTDPNTNFDIKAGINNSKWVYINNVHIPIPRTYIDVFGSDILGW